MQWKGFRRRFWSRCTTATHSVGEGDRSCDVAIRSRTRKRPSWSRLPFAHSLLQMLRVVSLGFTIAETVNGKTFLAANRSQRRQYPKLFARRVTAPHLRLAMLFETTMALRPGYPRRGMSASPKAAPYAKDSKTVRPNELPKAKLMATLTARIPADAIPTIPTIAQRIRSAPVLGTSVSTRGEATPCKLLTTHTVNRGEHVRTALDLVRMGPAF